MGFILIYPNGFPYLEIESSDKGFKPTFTAFASANRSDIKKKFLIVNPSGPTGVPLAQSEFATLKAGPNKSLVCASK